MSDILWRTLVIYGLTILVALGMALLIKLVVLAIQALERPPAPAAEPQAAPAVIDLDADHVAAIAAAVYSVIGAHRIVHIEAAHRAAGWVAEGRVAHHGSHAVSRHPHTRH